MSFMLNHFILFGTSGSIGAVTGNGTGAAVGAATAETVGAASAVAAAAAVGISTAEAVGSATGTATAAASAVDTTNGDGVAAASAVAAAVGESTAASIGAATGTGSVAGVAVHASIGAAAGSGTAAAVGAPIDANWANVVLLCSLAGADESTTFTDESPVGRTFTVVGNAKVDDGVTHFGENTGLFDGTGDYIHVPNASDISVANNNDKTIEAWFYINTLKGTQGIITKRDSSGAEEFSLGISSADKAVFQTFVSGSQDVAIIGATTLSTGVWYHIAAVRTNGADWQLFLDGVSIGTDSETAQPTSNTSVMYIGRNGFSSAFDFNGRISEARYTNAARYTANFTPPAAPYPRA